MLRRKSGFSVRIHVPEELRDFIGRHEVWRSTQTDEPQQARLRASQWRHHFGTLFLQLRKVGRSMAQAQLSALVSQYLEARLQDVEERLAVDLPMLQETDRDVWIATLAEELEGIERQLMQGDYAQTEAEARALLPEGADLAAAILSRRLLEAKFDALKAEIDALHGKPLRRAQIVARVADESDERAPAAAPKASPRVSEVFRDYIALTKVANKWRPKTLASREQAAQLLIDFLGDSPIAEVTRQTMSDAYLLLPRVPAHYTKRYKGLTPRLAIEAADKANDADRYSPKSCNLRLEVWKALFKYASDHDVILKSPADHLKAFAEGHAQDKRDAFTDEQMIAYFGLLKADMTDHPEHYWVALVMAYQGLRLEEAAALRGCDVRQVHGIWCAEVSSEASFSKTENSPRILPIHSALLASLKSYVKSRKGDAKANLWGLEMDAHGKLSAALSKRMNRRLEKAIANKPPRLVVESMRNTFATKLKAADVQEHVISELLGHAVSSLSVGRYGKKLEPAKLLDNIERLRLPAEILS